MRFGEILTEAKQQLIEDNNADQVICAVLSSGAVKFCCNHSVFSGDHSDEDSFIKQLAASDPEKIRTMICLWRNSQLDLPSVYFRRRIRELNLLDIGADILLQGTDGPKLIRFPDI
ncbi:MAG: hypothetical protein IJM80_04980 [Firmicutes bacterium]|nr:hypothetical protein [Bacillota bacterium]